MLQVAGNIYSITAPDVTSHGESHITWGGRHQPEAEWQGVTGIRNDFAAQKDSGRVIAKSEARGGMEANVSQFLRVQPGSAGAKE